MVPPERTISNSEREELFEILADWSEQLRHIDPSHLEGGPRSDIEEPQP